MYKNKNVSRKFSNRPWHFVVFTVLLLLVAAGLWKFVLHKHHAVSGPISASTPTSQSTAKKQAATPVSTDSLSSPGKTVASSAVGASSTTLASAPTGTFVSNHRPSLSGKSAPSGEQSACNTVPGATCYIRFTRGAVVKTLPTQTADSNGNVIWDWDVKQAGFDTGSWQITAIASLNGQAKSSSDSLALEVQP